MRSILPMIAVLLGLATPGLAKDPLLGGGFERHAAEHAFAASVMTDLNQHSIALNLEFCGFIYYDEFGDLAATPAEKGRPASCLPVRPAGNVRIFASYHTHAAYDANSFNEYPSHQDMEGDFSSRQNGYMATPGGRLWFTDVRKGVARQLCGYHCLPYDLRYRENRRAVPEAQVTLDDLTRIFSQGL